MGLLQKNLQESNTNNIFLSIILHFPAAFLHISNILDQLLLVLRFFLLQINMRRFQFNAGLVALNQLFSCTELVLRSGQILNLTAITLFKSMNGLVEINESRIHSFFVTRLRYLFWRDFVYFFLLV